MKILFKKYIPVFILIALFSNIVLMCSVPPVSRDALTHHLAVPSLYVQKGTIHELPDIIPSYYPQLLDLIYCIPLMFGNDIIPKYIHFAFALLTAGFIFLYLQQRLNHFYGLLSAFFFLSLPVIIKLSVTIYVDLGLIFFSFTSLICLIKWHEKQFQFKWLFISAVCCGLALSTKYNGLITFFLLTFFTPFIYLRGQKNHQPSQVKAIKHAVVFLFISILTFSPWMIKNYIWTNNPVFPLYDNYFNPKEKNDIIDVNSSQSTHTNHFLVRKYVYKESWWETALIPLRIFFQGEDDNPRLFDGKLNPLLFFLPLFAFINKKSHASHNQFEKKILLSFSLLYIMATFFQQDMRIRWIGPAIPPLVILSAYGLKNIFDTLSLINTKGTSKALNKYLFYKIMISFLIIIMFSLNFTYLYKLFRHIDPLPYLSNQITRSEYIEKFRPEYAALQFANHHLQGNIKLLAFFLGSRRYYSDHDIRFDDTFFKYLVQNSKTAKTIFHGLKTQNYTNFIINYSKLNTWINDTFNTDEKKRVRDFFRQYTKRLFSKGGHGVYQLGDSE